MATEGSEILVLSTTDSLELARRIAAALVEAREAACVNIVAGVVSIYRWQGEQCESQEWLMLIKSSVDRFEAVRARIRGMHSYQLPEVIALPIIAGDVHYLRWMAEQLGRKV
jgi:periplasmic divalent cation tolerance protein